MRGRVLLTGAGGFVGKVLSAQLIDAGYSVVGTSNNVSDVDFGHKFLDICDQEAVMALIKDLQPSYVIHLAAISHVPTSFKAPLKTWKTNVIGTLNLLGAIQSYSPETFVLFVSSSEVYGEAFKGGKPLHEGNNCQPMNPYAASKLAGELAVQQFFRAGGRGVIVRPFNHIGAGQSPDFVTASFAKQIVEIELELKPSILKVGNLDASRDFLDVRDVCSAYINLLEVSGQPLSERVFNIASGQSVKISRILEIFLSLSVKKIVVETDLDRLRPSEISVALGNTTRIRSLTGWQPKFDLGSTLLDVLNEWRKRRAIG